MSTLGLLLGLRVVVGAAAFMPRAIATPLLDRATGLVFDVLFGREEPVPPDYIPTTGRPT